MPEHRSREVVRLQQVRRSPAVSILMATTPRTSMTLTDQTRLEDHGVVMFAATGIPRSYRLPVPATDRVVVDHTFASRDLVLALPRTPRHVVLVLSSHDASRFESGVGSHRPSGLVMLPHP